MPILDYLKFCCFWTISFVFEFSLLGSNWGKGVLCINNRVTAGFTICVTRVTVALRLGCGGVTSSGVTGVLVPYVVMVRLECVHSETLKDYTVTGLTLCPTL